MLAARHKGACIDRAANSSHLSARVNTLFTPRVAPRTSLTSSQPLFVAHSSKQRNSSSNPSQTSLSPSGRRQAPLESIGDDYGAGSLSSIDFSTLSWTSPLEAWKQGQLAFGFSAGGLLFPYYLGVMWTLKDELGILTDDVHVAGASAGSLIAACSKAGISQKDLLQATLQLARDCRRNGTRHRLRSVLAGTLEDILPHDIHERCNGKVHVAVTHVTPKLRPETVNQYSSRQDLIDSLLISCHIPWYFDGTLATSYRGNLALDGGITNLIPVPPGMAGVRVCCFPSKALGKAFGGIAIAPDVYEEWKYPFGTMLWWAFHPAPEEMLLMLIEKGSKDARTWASVTGITQYIEADRKLQERLRAAGKPTAAGARVMGGDGAAVLQPSAPAMSDVVLP